MNEKIPTIKAKRITIDELARMVATGFTEMGHKMRSLEDRINDRIDGLENSLSNRIDMGIKGLQAQIDNMAINHVTLQEHRHLADRVKKVERKIGIN